MVKLKRMEKAKTDLTIAKDKGLDITAVFHNIYGSTAAFEQKPRCAVTRGHSHFTDLRSRT